MKNALKAVQVCAIAAAAFLFMADAAYAQRVKDIAHVKAAQFNILDGWGIVTGLQGTGDGDSKIVRERLANLYQRYNMKVDPADIKGKNVALVSVSAKVRSGIKEGMLVDIEVTSTGEAKSLKGGYLRQAWLYGPDRKQVYLIAYGAVEVAAKDVFTKGVVTSGGIVVTEIPITYSVDGKTISWVLEKPDTRTAVQVAQAFRDAFYDLGLGSADNDSFARAMDDSEIVVEIPEAYKDRTKHAEFVAILNSRTVMGVDVEARVIINLAKKTVVINGNVRVGECVVVVDGVEITVPAPADLTKKEKAVAVGDTDRGGEVGVPLMALKRVLNDIGVSNETLIDVIQEIDRAGKLYGKLEVR
jgi:flagellar P-ring protein precursor FlgI